MFKISPTNALELSKILSGKLLGENTTVEYLSTDTREEFYKNTCFIAIKGKNYNGNKFINHALEKKCSLIITDEPILCNCPAILVKNTKNALGLLAKAFSKKVKTIGITGSVGKTTVKDMICLVLNEKYRVVGTNKNENNEIGVAKTLFSIKEEDFCVIEMGMRALGEIEQLSFFAEPEISIITNCGTSHLELLGSEENIFKAKTEILKHTKRYALIPCEKRFFSIDYGQIKPIFVGKDIRLFDLNYNNEGVVFSAKYKEKTINDITLSTFNINIVTNALFAIAVGILCNVSDEQIKQGLKNYKGENMHEEILQISGITVIEDCYNASYESVKGAIFSLKKIAEIKKLTPNLLLGDMLEIGENSQEYHYRIGELAKDLGVKKLFAIGQYAKNITDGFSGGMICTKKEHIAEMIKSQLTEKDVILIKGSRAMRLEKIVEQMKEIK